MIKNFLAFVLRPSGHGDCTMGGLSSRVSNALVIYGSYRNSHLSDATGLSVQAATEIAKTMNDDDASNTFAIVEDVCVGTRRLRAIPCNLLVSGVWTMFGGNFLTSSDSRFFEHPIKIHDRVEN